MTTTKKQKSPLSIFPLPRPLVHEQTVKRSKHNFVITEEPIVLTTPRTSTSISSIVQKHKSFEESNAALNTESVKQMTDECSEVETSFSVKEGGLACQKHSHKSSQKRHEDHHCLVKELEMIKQDHYTNLFSMIVNAHIELVRFAIEQPKHHL